jgi:hypothetical protein
MTAGRQYCFTSSDREALGVDPTDERYFDLHNYCPKVRPGQTWVEARLEQVAAIQARDRETLAISDKSRKEALRCRRSAKAVTSVGDHVSICSGLCAGRTQLRVAFPELLPRKPFCADRLADGLLIRERASALKRRHIQLNDPSTVRWVVHDLDFRGAALAHEEGNLPPPNFLAINRNNGHAHAAVLLEVPVARHAAARTKPLEYLAAVERGLARRLGADCAYAGLIAKNPLHDWWDVHWLRNEPYSLSELEGWLFKSDMRPYQAPAAMAGLSRNCALFDSLRQLAYSEVRNAKRTGKSIAAFQAHLERRALELNRAFPTALPFSEIRAIAKSVAKWVWGKFSAEAFRQWQSRRGQRGNAVRWAGHISAATSKPWALEGISRATYYRRKAKGQET